VHAHTVNELLTLE